MTTSPPSESDSPLTVPSAPLDDVINFANDAFQDDSSTLSTL